MDLEGLANHAGVAILLHLIEKTRKLRFLKCRIIAPGQEMRISFAAIARVSQGGRQVLIQNLHRKEVFGPIGGVYKYRDPARITLEDRLFFRPQNIGPGNDMQDDLRGFLPRRNLSNVVRWFDSCADRESAYQCVRREIREELREIGLADMRASLGSFELDRVRRVGEGPDHVPGQQYTQYRIFDVFNFRPTNGAGFNFFERLLLEARTHPNLLLATPEEILRGRSSDGRIIGHHAAYLLRARRIRPDEPAFVSRDGSPPAGAESLL
jgi:hypothetical protein